MLDLQITQPLQKNCPKINCFHCLKLGHMKENCYKRKVVFIFIWLWEMIQKYIEALKKIYKQKEEIHLKFRESKCKKDGEVYKVFNKEILVGIYVGRGHLSNFNHTMKSNHAQQTNDLLKHV